MKLTYANTGTTAVFRLVGNLAAGEDLDGLHTGVAGVCGSDARAVLLDLAHVPKLDCWGIGELIRLRAAVVASGRMFALVNIDARKRRMLDMVKLTSVLGVREPARQFRPAPNAFGAVRDHRLLAV